MDPIDGEKNSFGEVDEDLQKMYNALAAFDLHQGSIHPSPMIADNPIQTHLTIG